MELTRRQLLKMLQAGGATLAVGQLAGFGSGTRLALQSAEAGQTAEQAAEEAAEHAIQASVAADPTHIPPPLHRDHPIHNEINLTAKEVIAEIAPGAQYSFMTFDGQVPGPFIRVRQGDTVSVTLDNAHGNSSPHNIDLHAVYGPGGGAAVMTTLPGKSKTFTFKAMYPGAFTYHCAAAGAIDLHMSSGMFGLILVEPANGTMPKVDREFYIGQNEIYTSQGFGKKGLLTTDLAAMAQERPSHVLFNGGVMALTGEKALKAKVGETVRIYLTNGGPNLVSSFHPIGNVWTRCWPQGAITNPPTRYVQTQPVSPGSAFVGDMELHVPANILLVDHSMSRVVSHGLLAALAVSGPENAEIFKKGPKNA